MSTTEFSPEAYPGVARIIEILARERGVEDIGAVLPEHFQIHVDDFSSTATPATWKGVMSFLWERGRLEQARGVLDSVEVHADRTVTVAGRWIGQLRGREVSSPPLSIRYREVDGQVVEMWSHVGNYSFFFPCVEYRLGQLLMFVYLRAWRALVYERRAVASLS